MAQPTTYDRFDRTMRWIGDLDHPFYAGFQLFIVLQLLMIGGAMVVAGRASLPYVTFALPAFVVGTLGTEYYARKHNAPYLMRWSDMRRGRGMLVLGIAALYLAGAVRIAFEPDSTGSLDPSLLIGAIAGFGGLAAGTWWRSRRAAAADLDDEVVR